MEDEQEEYKEELCHWCNGSGEGQAAGTRCPNCKGTGTEHIKQENDE